MRRRPRLGRRGIGGRSASQAACSRRPARRPGAMTHSGGEDSGLPLAARWFERRQVDADLTLIWEPHVNPLLRCNIWRLRGRDADLLVDTGLGLSSLRQAARELFE